MVFELNVKKISLVIFPKKKKILVTRIGNFIHWNSVIRPMKKNAKVNECMNLKERNRNKTEYLMRQKQIFLR